MQHNLATSVEFKGGWIGLFGGESQKKALDRVLVVLGEQDQRVVAVTTDHWSIAKRLWMFLLAIVSLLFYVRVPNLLVISEPLAPAPKATRPRSTSASANQ